MPLLFSYGTLQQESVQMSIFGRLLHGDRDELPGYGQSLVKINDPHEAMELGMTHYANVVHTGSNKSRIQGIVFDITDAELAAADEYEGPAGYERVVVELASGKEAWVYMVARPSSEVS